MKKILILGGSRYIIPVIEKAHDLGVFVITCDYLPNNIAHKYSDKYFNISIINKDEVLRAAIKEKIDGIISFACDPGVITAAYVADKMGLPTVGPYESVYILQNKNLFRSFLRDNGFNVPFNQTFSNKESVHAISHNISYPVIVKPVDSAGSKGVSVVNELQSLDHALDLAFSNSISKKIIIEEFLEYEGHPSDADSFIYNGKFLYFGLDSQLFDSKASNPFTPAAYYWPSTISDMNSQYLKAELERLFSLLKLNTAILNIEVRVAKNGKPYIMEVSPRGGGNRLTEMVRYGTGQDFIEEYLKFSLGISAVSINKIKQLPFDGFWTEIILHSDKDGIFKDVDIDKCLLPYLIEKDIWVKQGDLVNKFTGANQTIGTLVFKFKEKNQMLLFSDEIDRYIKVIVE